MFALFAAAVLGVSLARAADASVLPAPAVPAPAVPAPAVPAPAVPAPALPAPALPAPALPAPVGACGEVDRARLDAVGGVGAFSAAVAIGDLHAKVLAAGPVCRPAAGGTPSVELFSLTTIPGPGGPETSWSREHPLVLAPLPGEVRVGRWPLAGVAAERDPAVVRRLIRVDRQLYASRRVAVLRVEPGERAAEVDTWIGELARAGYVAVGLVVDPEAWRPAGTPKLVTPAARGPVRVPEEVVASTEGDFTARFPSSTGIRPVDIPAQDVRYFEEACRAGTCDLVLVTDDERILVRRATEAPADDLTRRWLFGHPVVVAKSSSVGHLAPPTFSGTLTALPEVMWLSSSEPDAEPTLLEYIYNRGNFLIRPCWIKKLEAWRAVPFLSRNPFGHLQARMFVAADGRVEQVDIVDTDLVSRAVIQCTVRGMRAMRLPRSPDGRPYALDVPYGFGNGD